MEEATVVVKRMAEARPMEPRGGHGGHGVRAEGVAVGMAMVEMVAMGRVQEARVAVVRV